MLQGHEDLPVFFVQFHGAAFLEPVQSRFGVPQVPCPKGWSEIGPTNLEVFGASAACMGMSPCSASEASLIPIALQCDLQKNFEQALNDDFKVWAGDFR
jgi:hypothetical protein